MSFNCLVKFGSFSTTEDRTAPIRTEEPRMDENLNEKTLLSTWIRFQMKYLSLQILCLPRSKCKMFWCFNELIALSLEEIYRKKVAPMKLVSKVWNILSLTCLNAASKKKRFWKSQHIIRGSSVIKISIFPLLVILLFCSMWTVTSDRWPDQ